MAGDVFCAPEAQTESGIYSPRFLWYEGQSSAAHGRVRLETNRMKSRKQVLKKRFLSTLYLSAFTFGGGYVIVTQHSWLSLQEFADLVAMAAIFAVCLVLLRKTKLSPILVMLLAGAVNLLLPA